MSLTDVRREEHHVEGGEEVVDALHVSASGVSNCPYVEYPLHRTLNLKEPAGIQSNNMEPKKATGKYGWGRGGSR